MADNLAWQGRLLNLSLHGEDSRDDQSLPWGLRNSSDRFLRRSASESWRESFWNQKRSKNVRKRKSPNRCPFNDNLLRSTGRLCSQRSVFLSAWECARVCSCWCMSLWVCMTLWVCFLVKVYLSLLLCISVTLSVFLWMYPWLSLRFCVPLVCLPFVVSAAICVCLCDSDCILLYVSVIVSVRLCGSVCLPFDVCVATYVCLSRLSTHPLQHLWLSMCMGGYRYARLDVFVAVSALICGIFSYVCLRLHLFMPVCVCLFVYVFMCVCVCVSVYCITII